MYYDFVQEEKAIRLLGAGTLSILVIIICLVLAIITRPKSMLQVKPVSFNSIDTLSTPTTQIESQGSIAGTETVQTPTSNITSQKYTVQAGDTLYGIALKFKVNWKDIAKANNITDTGSLREGQELIIP